MASAWLSLTQWPSEQGLCSIKLPSISEDVRFLEHILYPSLKGCTNHIGYRDSDKELKKKIPYGDISVSHTQQQRKHSHSFTQLHPV